MAPAPLDPGLSAAPLAPAPATSAGGPQDAWQATPALEMAQMLSALHQAVAPAPLPRDGAPSPYPAAAYTPAGYPQPDLFQPQGSQPVYQPQGSQPAYAPQPTYRAQPAYAPQPTYQAQPAYAPQATYQAQPAYAPQAAYPPQPAYAPQPAYPPQPEHVPQAYVAPPAPAQSEGGWHSPSVGPGFKRPNEGTYAAPRVEPERQQTAWSAPVVAPGPSSGPSRPQGYSGYSGNPGSSGDVGEKAVQLAKQFIGTPYVWGGESPRGFDCSGLVQFVYDKLGVDIPRVAQDQAQVGQQVGKSNLAPGDLVYFRNTGNRTGITHIGMYAGDGKFIHAPKTGDVVKVSDLSDDYYQDHFAGATRIA